MKISKREADRRARRDLQRIIELADRGFSTATIASSVGMEKGAVQQIIERVRVLGDLENGGEGGLLG